MNWKTMLGVIGAAGLLAASFVLWNGGSADWLKRNSGQHPEKDAAQERLDNAMKRANKSLEISEVVRGGPELVGSPTPFATYTVRVIQEPSKEVYFFGLREYTIDIGSGAETGKLCEKVAAATPQKKKDNSTGSQVLDDAEVSFGFGPVGIQAPLSSYRKDVGRVLGTAASEGGFSKIEILIKGFADGTISNWKLELEPSPYDFHEITILPQLDTKSSHTPRRFASTPTKVFVGNQYGNEDLSNLRAAFVVQDIVKPMLATCLKDWDATIGILEGYTSNRPRNPLQRKVEVYLFFYE